MAELLRGVGVAIPLLAVVMSLVGGLFALSLANRGGLRARPDRGSAAGIATVLACIAGGVTAVITSMIGSAWGGGNWLAGMPVAVVVFGFPTAMTVFGASTLGYVGQVRLRPSANGALGAALGPVVLGAACLAGVGVVGVADDMVAAAYLEQDRQEVAANSAGLHLTIDEVVTTVDGAGLVSSVRVRLTIRSDSELTMELLPGKLVYPTFVLSPDGDDPNAEMQAEAAAGSPAVLAAGSETHYDVLFDPAVTGTSVWSAPGEWQLEIRIGGADGERYGLEAPIQVEPNG
jgi:hypothetical protein